MNINRNNGCRAFVVGTRLSAIAVTVALSVKTTPLQSAEVTAHAEAMAKGSSHVEDGHFDLAISAFTEAIRLEPKNAVAFYERAFAYASKGDHDKAVADYTEAIRIRPDFARAFLRRGLAHERRGEHDKAIADYTEVVRREPDSAKAYYFRGNACRHDWEHRKRVLDNEVARINEAGIVLDWPAGGVNS